MGTGQGWRNRYAIVAILSEFLVAASPDRRPRLLVIPGHVRSVPAPDGSGARIFYRPHMVNGGQESPVFYDDGRGHVTQVATLMRNMGISWSPDGTRVFLQDNWGSDIADCYVLSRTSAGITGVSLSKLIRRTPSHPTAAEMQGHYYVGCDRWRSSDQITGSVTGHTDTEPLRGFDHPFIYDMASRHVTWRR